MHSCRVMLGLCAAAAFLAFGATLSADTYSIILHGKVTMPDGAPPPISVGIERICSNSYGSAPGPVTNKKGEYIWRMDIDPLEERDCRLRATHTGYVSTQVEVSGVDTTQTALTLPTIIITAALPDARAIVVPSPSRIPSRAKKDWDAAMKALDASHWAEGAMDLEAVVADSPKFAEAWHDLGIVDGLARNEMGARDAFEHAIKVDPKLLAAYVMLSRTCLRLKDWQAAQSAADELIKADPKHLYPEIYMHLAVAQYGEKDYAAAESSIQEAIRLDTAHKRAREEWVLGRILEAKGDLAGAKEHMSKYLQMDPAPPDVDLVKGHLQLLGKAQAAEIDPQLEVF